VSAQPPVTPQAQPQTAALFVSDLHLSAQTPHTTAAFFKFLQQHAPHTQQLYLLGDIFEYWAGDDDIEDAYNQSVVAALKEVSSQGVQTLWIAGNRDFLVGDVFAAASGLTRLPDPSVIQIAGQPVLITHGDAYCTDDHDYLKFRAQVRDTRWQADFLAKPLAERKQIIATMRDGSRAAQREKSMAIMDVTPDTIDAAFRQHAVRRMIHGHTHRPATHQSDAGIRYVLPDWDLDHAPQRGGWLAADLAGEFHVHRIAK
jgi:UDP-2,3-diacylglucosamine hydrolase